MKNPFQPGDRKFYQVVVNEHRLARFDAGLVHPVYGTFALGQDAEWVCRLFVLDMLETNEEGVGSYLSIRHASPAPLGATVELVAELVSVEQNRIRCRWSANWDGNLIAEGEQEQLIVDAKRFSARLQELQRKVMPGLPEG